MARLPCSYTYFSSWAIFRILLKLCWICVCLLADAVFKFLVTLTKNLYMVAMQPLVFRRQLSYIISYGECALLNAQGWGAVHKVHHYFWQIFTPPSPVTHCHTSQTPFLKLCQTFELKINNSYTLKFKIAVVAVIIHVHLLLLGML